MSRERSDLLVLFSSAIEVSHNTQSPGGVQLCVAALNQLRSLNLSSREIFRLSESISELHFLRFHMNIRIRVVAESLFNSWMGTMYKHGRSVIDEAEDSKGKNIFVESKKDVGVKEEDGRSKTHDSLELKKKEGFSHKYAFLMTDDPSPEEVEEQAKTDLKPEDTYRQSSTASLIPSSRSVGEEQSAAAETKTEKELKKKKRQVVARKKVKLAAMKKEFVELFESANKSADRANAAMVANGVATSKLEKAKTAKAKNDAILLVRKEVRNCVDSLSLLMKFDIAPKPTEPRNMMERLKRLSKHKYNKISNAATILLDIWKKRIIINARKTRG